MSNRICEHIQDDGLRCQNPTMYRRQLCFFHWQLHRPTAAVTDPAYVPPVIDSEASIVIACSHLLRAVLSGKIDLRRAQVAMSCLRQAATCFRLQHPAGEHAEVNFTRFMANYFSNLDEAQAQAFAAYPDPHPLVYPAPLDVVESDNEPLPDEEQREDVQSEPQPTALSSRAPLLGEGSASSSSHDDRPNDRGRAGLQPRVDEREPQPTPLSSRATLSGEGSASSPNRRDDRPNDRGRAGLQPRVTEPDNVGALAPVDAVKKPPLSATQTKLLKQILRRGPSDPRFKQATRLLDRHIAATSA